MKTKKLWQRTFFNDKFSPDKNKKSYSDSWQSEAVWKVLFSSFSSRKKSNIAGGWENCIYRWVFLQIKLVFPTAPMQASEKQDFQVANNNKFIQSMSFLGKDTSSQAISWWAMDLLISMHLGLKSMRTPPFYQL